MSKEHVSTTATKEEAVRFNTLMNTMSLLARQTMVEWLPEVTTEVGITGERFMVMFELNLQPNSSLKQLATSLVVSSSSLSVMVNSMVEQGIVSRLQDPQDRRRVVLRLSDEGERQLALVENHLIDRFQEYLNCLSKDDRADLDTAVETLLHVVNRILGRPSDGTTGSSQNS